MRALSVSAVHRRFNPLISASLIQKCVNEKFDFTKKKGFQSAKERVFNSEEMKFHLSCFEVQKFQSAKDRVLDSEDQFPEHTLYRNPAKFQSANKRVFNSEVCADP